MPYRMAGIDVHKKRLAVVVADVEVEDEYQFERRWYGSNPEQLRVLSEWLIEQQVEEVVMESTAQYWKPVWESLERFWKAKSQSREGSSRMSGTLHLAQALSNRGRRGRKSDFKDAERLVKRLVSAELVLSFVPDAEKHLWPTLTPQGINGRVTSFVRRTSWRHCWKNPISNCPVWFQICWVPVHVVCSRR